MIKIGLICNTTSAFQLLQWLKSQNLLVGVAVLNVKNDFLSDVSFICSQLGVGLTTIEKAAFNQELIDWQEKIKADLVLVLGFPFKIKAKVFDIPKYGYFNIHFGALPKYGGSFPVFWQILNQEITGELTIHKMDKSYDTGPIAVKIPFNIIPSQTYGMVESNYATISINGVYLLIDSILRNVLTFQKQAFSDKKYFPKPQINDLVIDWERMDAGKIVALTKATNPWNRGAIARINNLDLKVIEAELGNTTLSENCGELIEINENGITVVCQKNKSIVLKITYSQFGYLVGNQLEIIGLKIGDRFQKINL